MLLSDMSFAKWYNYQNKRAIFNVFENGSCPKPNVMQGKLIYREVVIKELREILRLIPDHSSYHIIVGNYGTGKTTAVRQCANDVRKGVIYVDISPVLDDFIDNLAKAIGYSFKEYVSFAESFKQKILGYGGSGMVKQSRFFLVRNAFE